MLAALAFLRPAGAVLGGIFGWVLGDWRRVMALLVVGALIVTYVVADRHRAAADAVLLKARIDQLTTAFIRDADAAQAAETKRQAEIGVAVTRTYQQQLAARDRADADQAAQTEKEIADYEKRLAAMGRSCGLDADDIRLLDPQPAAPPGGR